MKPAGSMKYEIHACGQEIERNGGSMKKGLMILLGLIMGLSPLMAGGQTEAEPEGPVELVLAIKGGDSDVEAYTALLETAAESVADVNVKVILYAKYDETVTTRLVSGEQIDIMNVSESVHQFSSRNQLEPLNAYISEAGLDMEARFGAGKDLYSRDGQVYALPLRGGPMVVYCNMDLLDEKPQIDWTFEDLQQAALKTYKPGANAAETVWGFVPAGNGTWWPWYTSFIYAAGGSVLDAQGKPNFNDPRTIQGLANYVSFANTPKSGPSLLEMADLGQTSPDPVFNSGKAAMITTGWWNVGSLQNADFNWDVAPIPNGEGKGTVIFGQGLAVTATSKYKKQAFEVISALTDVKAQEQIIDLKWDIPSNVDVLNSPAFTEAQWSAGTLDMQAVADAISKGSISLPFNPEWNEMNDIIANVVNELLTGSMTVEDAAARIQKDLETQVFN